MKALLLSLLLILPAAGCSSGNYAAWSAWGKPHHIKQFSGGKLIGEWDSVGKIENESHSDGYYFEDKATRRLILVSGDVQITVID
jgi:hypothetical protein